MLHLHTVREGETLDAIQIRYGVCDLDRIAAYNALDPDAPLAPGARPKVARRAGVSELGPWR